MIELVEFEVPFIVDGEIQFGKDEEVIKETRQGVILHWGVQPIKIEESISQTTVVFVKESESGKVIRLDPEELTFL